MNHADRYRSVVVTAAEASTSLGTSLDETWEALLAGRSGVRPLGEDRVIPELACHIGGVLNEDPADNLKRVEARRLDFAEQLALVVSRRLWEQAGSPDVDLERLGVVIGTGAGGAASTVATDTVLREKGPRKVSPHAVAMMMANGPAAIVGVDFKAKAGVHSPISACASGNEAIADAWRMIAMDDADIVICGGVEGRIGNVAIASFTQLRAMSTSNDKPEEASRPFAKDRNGFVFGEAGAMLLLESEEHAKARGATILARVLGAGLTSDGYHIVAPEPHGEGAARAITKSLRSAGLNPTDVDHINAHATSTSVGDLAESRAILSSLGDHVSVYAPKSALGHSIGAVGALEAAITIKTLQNQIVPATLNLSNDNLDPEIGIDVVYGKPRKQNINIAINDSFGFGGHNVAVVFGKY